MHTESCMELWGQNNYLMEAKEQLRDKRVHKEVNFAETLIQDLKETSNKMFRSLKMEIL